MTRGEKIALVMGPRGWVDRVVVPAAAAVVVVAWVVLVVLFAPHVDGTGDVMVEIVLAGTAVPPVLLGWRIVALDPGNVVGRRLVWLGLALAWMWVSIGLIELGAAKLEQPDAMWVRWLALLADSAYVVMFVAFVALVLVFPEGRAPSPAWQRRMLAWNWFFAAAIALSLLDGGDLVVLGDPDVARIDSPLPVWPPAEVIGWLSTLVLVGVLVATVVAVRGRFTRATGIERLQLTWLSYAAALVPLSIVACLAEFAIVGDIGALTFGMVGLMTVAVPVAITVAVLRHRLYDIERLVNRTLVYGALTLTLAAVFGAVAILAGIALGGGTAWATAAAAVVAVMAFQPMRARMQRAVDRRFAQRRYEGLRLVEEFLDDVRAGRLEPELIAEVLGRALQDRGLEVFFLLPASGRYAHASGRIAELPTDDIRTRFRVLRGELELGVIVHDPELNVHADTFQSIVRAAGLAIEIARLRVEVRVQLAEVEASRGRIVAAADAERRKVQRDLHDGAQQRLVALGLALRHAQMQLGEDSAAARGTLDQAVDEVTTAVAELREIARGLRPGVLDGAGLAGALSEVAGRCPVPVALEITSEQLSPQMEATVFFLACEAVTNTIKHAGAAHIRIRIDRHGEQLRLEVADDGVGGARMFASGGLAGMTQRTLAGGGRLHVDSPAGGGTRIVAELPVGLA